MQFYDSYGFFSFGDGYLLLKGYHPCHHFFIPHCSCLVMLDNVNGQNGHLCTFMIHMASFIPGMDTFYQKVIIHAIAFSIPTVLA